MAYKQQKNTDTGALDSLSAIGAVPNVNGASIVGTALNLQPASSTLGGVVTASAQSFGGAKTFVANIELGVASTTAGQTTMYNATNAFTTVLKSGVAAANQTFTLPTTTGAANQVLTTDGTGILSWVSNTTANSVATKTAAYTIVGEDAIFADTTGGAFAITLPAATTTRTITVKKTDASANALTVTAAGADLVDGAASYILVNSGFKPSITLISNQVDKWFIV